MHILTSPSKIWPKKCALYTAKHLVSPEAFSIEGQSGWVCPNNGSFLPPPAGSPGGGAGGGASDIYCGKLVELLR